MRAFSMSRRPAGQRSAPTTSPHLLPGPPMPAQWTPDGLNVMTGSASGSMAIWSGSVFTFQLLRRLCSRALRVLRWSHNGEWLLSADDTGEVLYWEKGNSRQQGFPAHRDVVRAISFSPTGEPACRRRWPVQPLRLALGACSRGVCNQHSLAPSDPSVACARGSGWRVGRGRAQVWSRRSRDQDSAKPGQSGRSGASDCA